MTLLNVFQQNNLIANAVVALLLVFSLLSWHLIFYKTHKLYCQFKALAKINHLFDANKLPSPQLLQQQLQSVLPKNSVAMPLLDLLAINYKIADKSLQKELINTKLIQQLDEIRYFLDKGLVLLGSIGSSSPFIGLFGTVLGIYHGFDKIASSGSASISIVAGPIAESLVTTAIGLAVAIPAVLAYNGIVRYNRLLVQKLRHLSENICLSLLNDNA